MTLSRITSQILSKKRRAFGDQEEDGKIPLTFTAVDENGDDCTQTVMGPLLMWLLPSHPSMALLITSHNTSLQNPLTMLAMAPLLSAQSVPPVITGFGHGKS